MLFKSGGTKGFITIILTTCLLLGVNAQDSLFLKAFPMTEGKITYERIFEIDSVSKQNIFGKIKDWAVDSYRSQKATLESEDKDLGYIAYKGYLASVLNYEAGLFKGKPYEVQIWHTLKFYIKDGKVRLLFTDLRYVSMDAASVYVGGTEKMAFEDWEILIANRPKKKQAETREFYERSAAKLDQQIREFLDKAVKEITTKKSAFDF